MVRYCVGIVQEKHSTRAVVVTVRAARLRATSVADSPLDACAQAIAAARIEPHHIIGIGIAHPRAAQSPGLGAGGREALMPQMPGLSSDIPLIHALDTHACVPGSGVASPSTVVIVSGEPTMYLMNSRIEADVANVSRGAADLILPGYFGYEIAGPAEPFSDEISAERKLEIAFDLRRKCEALRAAGAPVRRFVAAGTLAQDAPVMMQLLADVLDARIKPGASDDPAPLGAAILAAIAAGTEQTGHASISQTIHAMAPRRMHPIHRPDLRARKEYDRLYESSRRR